MKFTQFVLTILIAAVVSYGITHYSRPAVTGTESAGTVPSAYNRVIASKEIRCAYATLYPHVIVDPNTGQLSGIAYDTVNEIGKRLGMKVSWVEEVGYGNVNAGFETGRYDAFCAGLWPSGVRSPTTVFSNPVGYDVVAAWVRADDTRFDGDLAKLNDSAYTVIAFDGDTTMSIAKNIFPKAKILAMSHNQSTSEANMQIVDRKADAQFNTYTDTLEFVKKNPGSLKALQPPVRVIPLTIGFNDKELLLKKLVDPVIDEMHDDGTLQRIAAKYLGEKQSYFLMPTAPYKP